MAAHLTPTWAYLLCLVLQWSAVAASGAESESNRLQPYQATYRTKALAFVHRTRFSRNFGIGFTQDRIVYSYV